jgi:Kef-type K+ transport system membrane component KefB
MKRSERTLKVARYFLSWAIGCGTISIALFFASIGLLLSLQMTAGILVAILGFCFGFIACRLLGDACRLFNISQIEKNFEANALNRKQNNN